MTEQSTHEEREQNSARDGDAGFAALEATEPHFGSSALQGSAFESSDFSAPVSFEPAAPPVEVGGFEALNFEAPAPLAEPTLTWEAPPAVLDSAPAALPHEKPVSKKPVPESSVSKGHAPTKWVRNSAMDPVAAEEFPDWHPAAHGFVEESIARDNGGDYPGYFPVPTAPFEPVPGGEAEQGAEESSEGSPRRSLRVDPNLPAVSIDEAPVRAFMPGGAEPRPMAAGAARVCGADYAVSTTGVAGPDPADGQPVGTVFIGVHAPGGCEVFERHYDGDRAQVRAAASADAIALLARAVRGSASGSLRESL